MADPLPAPPSPPPPDPNPPTPAAGKSPKKQKRTTVAGSPANKRRKRGQITIKNDGEDTATSKRKFGKEIGKDLDHLDDIEVLESLLEYRSKNGEFPFENPTAMENFLRPWLIFQIGNEDGWKTKLEQVKNKFKKEGAPIEDEERKEFELWMKIWGNDGGDDDDPT